MPATQVVSITTDASGDATVRSGPVHGRILKIIYTKDTFDNGVDFTITTNDTGQTVWTESNVNATKSVLPRDATHDNVGAASLYAAVGEPVEDYIWAIREQIKFVIAQGGNVKKGSFRIITDE